MERSTSTGTVEAARTGASTARNTITVRAVDGDPMLHPAKGLQIINSLS
jgi:hypothetical protein